MTLGELVNAEPALGRLLSLPLPVKAAYHVAKLARLIGPEIAHFSKQQQELVAELGEERPATHDEELIHGSGTMVRQVPAANHVEYKERLGALAALVIEIPFGPIDIGSLGDIAITGADLLSLEPLLAA